MLELRCDTEQTPDGLMVLHAHELRALRERVQRPLVLALNDATSFGAFRGSMATRQAWMQLCSEAGVDWVDVPLAALHELGPRALAATGHTRRIVSLHSAPWSSQAQAQLQVQQLVTASQPGDVLKLVPQADDGVQALRSMEWGAAAAWEGRRHVLFASGAEAQYTRVLAPVYSSAWVYARAQASAATAPGQLTAAALRAAWPRAGCTPATRMLAVLGDPIAHSVSPQVHTCGLRELDLDAVYVAVRCADLAGFAQQLAPQWRGLALTAPLKLQAARLASECSTLVTQAGAANTWVRCADGAWHAHNTDGIGLERAVQRLWPRGRHTRITVLGTGGAARTAVWALHGMSLEEPVRVWGRRTAEAQALAAEAGTSAWSSTDIIESDLLIDCTSAALRGEVPLSPAQYAGTPHVMASTYRPLDTPLLRAARARGCATSDGRWWFLEQACAQFELQQGVPAPRAAMEAQLQAELGSAAQSDVEAWS